MAFKNWQFSDEVQNELEQFLNTVEQHSIPNNRVKSIFEKIHPLPQQHSTTIYNKTINNETLDNENNDCTQILDSTQICNEISLLNLTCTKSNENTLNPEVNNFIEFIEENLEDTILDKSDVIKLSSEYNVNSLIFLFNKLSEVISDQGLYHLNRSFCVYPDVNLNHVMELFCRNLLLPRVYSTIIYNNLINSN